MKNFLPKFFLRNGLRHKYHLGVLVCIWNKNRSVRIVECCFRFLPHGHMGLIVSLKLCQNLCSFRLLKFSLKRVSSFKPLISWTGKTEISLGLTKLKILDLNVFIEPMFLRSWLRLPDSLAQYGRKDNSKAFALSLKVSELKIELNMFLYYHMDWDGFEGKIVANLRLFCERRYVFYSIFYLPKIPNLVLDKFNHDLSP